MKAFYLFTFITSLISNSLFSQFREGYIIENNNDTIYGYIDFEGSINNSKHCAFKTLSDSTVHEYYPGDIQAFRFLNSKYFITSEIPINNKPQKVFMEWLIKGRASILAYSPPNMNARYYILLKNDSLYELQNTSQIEEIKNIAYDHNNKEYIGALLYYLRDCPSISSNIETAAYNSKSLIKIAKKYHEKTCANEKCIVFEDKSRKLKYELGLSFGSLNSQLLLNNTIPEKVDLTRSMGYGIVINTSNLPLVSQKFSFRIQIMYFNSLYTYDTEGLYWSTDDRICRINYLRIPFQLKYKFSYKKLSPFVSLGFTANVRFDYKEYDKTLVSYVTEHFRYDLGMKPCQVGFNGGLGLEYSISPKVAINFGFEYEYTGSFFGTYIGEKSYSNNYLIQTSILYKMK